ncbi:MAG: isoprenyl transferase [Thermodesulfovibrionales bacterium]
MTGKLPNHVGIIMDGNGRWAELRGLPRVEGHKRGADRSKEIIRAAVDLDIKALTLYAFSMENWQRPKDEVSFLMKLLELYLKRELADILKLGIRFRAIGELWRLPDNIQGLLRESEEKTAANSGMTLVAALSYGGRSEIIRAVKKAIVSGMDPEAVDEESFSQLLDTAGLPHPDLIIRTSGERRLSNFLLWQSAYSELYFTDTLWPDFTSEEFAKAVRDFQVRERRFGAVPLREN